MTKFTRDQLEEVGQMIRRLEEAEGEVVSDLTTDTVVHLLDATGKKVAKVAGSSNREYTFEVLA